MTIERGDTVVLTSGSPTMLVLGGVRDEATMAFTQVTCVWFEGETRCMQAYSVEQVQTSPLKPEDGELVKYIQRLTARQDAQISTL